MRKPLQSLLTTLFVSGNLFAGFAQTTGDTIVVDGLKLRLIGENIISNPGFEDGFTGWTDATSAAATLTSTNFTLNNTGGVDNSAYIIGKVNANSSSAGSIGTGWPVEADKKYLFYYHIKYVNSASASGTEEWVKVSLTNNKNAADEPLVLLNEAQVDKGEWTKNSIVFTNSSPSYSHIVARFRWLNNRLAFDEFGLYEVDELPHIEELQSIIDEALSIYNSELNGADLFMEAIETAKSFLESESSSDVAKAISDLKKATQTFRMQSASPENPLDMTSFIENQGFDENTGNGWKGIGVINYHEVEFYEKTFDMYQDIEGLPAGKYIMKAQGFERPKANDSGAAYKAGTEMIYARFYAKGTSYPEKSISFNSLYKHTYSGSGSSNNYVNSMAAAETMFNTAGKNYYDTDLNNIIIGEGDILRIGAKSDFKQNGYWTLFDNFRLLYLGPVEASDLKVAIAEHIAEAESMFELKMSNQALAALNSCIAIAKDAIESEDDDKLQSVQQMMNKVIVEAELSVTVYSNLHTAIEEGYELMEYYEDVKARTLQKAIDEAKVLVDNLDAEQSALETALANLNNIVVKKIYIPTWMMGDVNNPANQWTMERSHQSKSFILFWEEGYGQDPRVVADGNYRVNTDNILELAETCFHFYADSLKFITKGKSKTDDYKMIIRLRHTRDWEATGSGVDDQIGLLTLTAWSAQSAGHTLAHEVGHCFQYQVHCDNGDQNGWMYGYGTNGAGGNGWWEQCAQWQGFKIFPTQQFTDGRYANYLNTAHKHILHETPRYDNYFIQDYWTYRRGMDIIGRLWNESKYPEDPVDTYKRINSVTQSEFNDEMYDCAARFATWDIPDLIEYGNSRFSARPQTSLTDIGDDVWQINYDHCPENYGYNVIKLNAPSSARTVSVLFEGKPGLTGYRKKSISYAGWRFGFVALLKDGTRVYSEMGSASFRAQQGTVVFDCPDNCKNLWLVVTGAPSTHWKHAWDDDDSNDEQWPYQVKFINTNLSGKVNVTGIESVTDNSELSSVYVIEDKVYVTGFNGPAAISIVDITGRVVLKEIAEGDSFSAALPKGIYIVSVNSGNRNVSRKIIVQ